MTECVRNAQVGVQVETIVEIGKGRNQGGKEGRKEKGDDRGRQ